tara:strand:+ start:1531 stop:6240 length:4710 start_codon:yes stop_codon:yes gene_type:complete
MPSNIPTNYKIKKPGWYLLSTFEGESLNQIIEKHYPKYTHLDISQAYLPLIDEILDNDQDGITPGNGPNGVTEINANELVFNQTIGEVGSSDQFNTQLVGFIDDFHEPFSENTGIWVLIYAYETPHCTLYLSISNEVFNDFPTVTNYIGELDLSYSYAIDIDIIVERTFTFNTSSINAYVDNDGDLDISYNIFHQEPTTNTYTLATTTTTFTTEQRIKYTVDNSFVVTINFLITDTIFPTISFNESENEDGTISDINYHFSRNNIRCASNNEIHHIDISLGQSFVKKYGGSNLLPKVVSYDQNNPQLPLTVEKISSDYTNRDFQAGIYNITYQSIDDYSNKTSVSVSFEIFDDIPPVIVVSNSTYTNNPTIYTNIVSNTDYMFEQSINIDVDQIQSGSGYTVYEGKVDFSFSSDIEPIQTINFFIKWDDVKEQGIWYFPKATYSDFSGVDLGSSTGVISIPNADTTNVIDYIRDVPETYANCSIFATQTFSISDNNNNLSEISFNISIFDDSIPIVNITYKRTSSQYGANYEIYPDEKLITDNKLLSNTGNILGDIHDNISFDFSMNKSCSCKVIFNYNSTFKNTFVNSNSSSHHTINLGHNLVTQEGIYSIFFVIWDIYGNYVSFRKDIYMTNNPSPELVDLFADLSDSHYDLDNSFTTFLQNDFTDLSTNHYSLNSNYNNLESKLTDVSNNHYNLDHSFADFLQNDFTELSSNYYVLTSTLSNFTEARFNDLSTNHNNLDNSFASFLQNDLTELYANNTNIDSSLNSLKSNLTDLSGKHYILSDNFSTIESQMNDLSYEFDTFTNDIISQVNTSTTTVEALTNEWNNVDTLLQTINSSLSVVDTNSPSNDSLQVYVLELINDSSINIQDISGRLSVLNSAHDSLTVFAEGQITDLSTSHYNLESSLTNFTAGPFTDLSTSHHNLESSLTNLTEGHFTDLSTSHYNLELAFNDLSGNHYTLENSLNTFLNNDFADISSNHYILNNSFNTFLQNNFDDLSSNHYNLENIFNTFLANDFTNLSTNHNNLDSSLIALEIVVDDLSGKQYLLEASLNQLTKSGDFVELSGNFYTLESSFNSLNIEFNDLSGEHYTKFTELSNSLSTLESSFNILDNEFNILSSKTYSLETSLNQLTQTEEFIELSENVFSLESSFIVLDNNFSNLDIIVTTLSGVIDNINQNIDTEIKGVLQTFTESTNGLVPAPNSSGDNNCYCEHDDVSYYLRVDGTWATPVDNNFTTEYKNMLLTLNTAINTPYIPEPYIARQPSVTTNHNNKAFEVGTDISQVGFSIDPGSIELLGRDQYYDDSNNVVDNSNNGSSRYLGFFRDIKLRHYEQNYYISPLNVNADKFDISLIDLSNYGNNILLDTSHNGIDFYEIIIYFYEGPIPKNFGGFEVQENIYTLDKFPFDLTSEFKPLFKIYPSHFNYQGTDVSENNNDTSWCELLKNNDTYTQPITAHHMLQYQPVDDNPETSFIHLNYTHKYNDIPHRFYISNTLYNYWTVTDYSKNLQIFSPNITEDGWIKENMQNWNWDNTTDIYNTNNVNKRYSIEYRKIICTDNVEIQAKKYRIGFI